MVDGMLPLLLTEQENHSSQYMRGELMSVACRVIHLLMVDNIHVALPMPCSVGWCHDVPWEGHDWRMNITHVTEMQFSCAICKWGLRILEAVWPCIFSIFIAFHISCIF